MGLSGQVHMHGRFPSTAEVEAIWDEELMQTGAEIGELVREAWSNMAHREVPPAEVLPGRSAIKVVVQSRDFVLRLLEKGTGLKGPRKHMIMPKKGKKALKFADGTFRSRSAGMKPRRYLRKAKAETRPEVERLMEGVPQRVAARIRGAMSR